jgi:hypothetical protein
MLSYIILEKMSVDKLSLDKNVCRQMSVDKMSVDKICDL